MVSTGGRAVIAEEVVVTAVAEPLAAGNNKGDGDNTSSDSKTHQNTGSSISDPVDPLKLSISPHQVSYLPSHQ